MKKQPISHNGKPRICFVAHFAYGAMCGGDHGIGGVQRQTSLMARWFARQGYQVSMLTWDEGQEDGTEIDGVRVFKMCRQDAGVRGLRFFWPRWSSLNAAMKRADADIYYQNCMGYETGQVALWCRRHGRKFVYSVANDMDCHVKFPSHVKFPKRKKLQDKILFMYGLRHADKVIAQTKKQQSLLHVNYKLDSLVVPMPCPDVCKDDNSVGPETGQKDSNRVLWIGRICEQKRPDRLLELAEACPDLQFDFVGPTADSEYASSVCDRAKTIENITVHGSISRRHVPKFYKKAKVLCCTSDYEGFPNTFLEAWSHSLPIVSTFDPDSVIADHGLGIVAKDVSGLVAGIRGLLDSPERWGKASQTARHYYLEHHTIDAVMAKFEWEFVDLPKRSCPITGDLA